MSELHQTDYRVTRSLGMPFARIADGNRSATVFDDGQG